MTKQVETREMGEVMLIEENQRKSESGLIVISEGDTIRGVYYPDSQETIGMKSRIRG